MSSISSASTHSTTVTELNLDELNRTITACTTVDNPEIPEETEQKEDQRTNDHPELRSAIHAIMSDSASPPHPQINPLRKDVGWISGDASYGQLQTYEQFQESRSKAQYYNKAFAIRDQPNSTRDRLLKTSVITAEIKTNVILQDEFTFLTTMSAFFAARYNRPESSVLITLDHSACMLFGGSFEPAYLLTISAISEQVQATMNRRNAALVQQFLAEELLVPAERGIIKFHALAEENVASAGTTLAAEISREVKSPSPTGTAKEEQSGMSLSRRLLSRKRASTRSTPQQSKPIEESNTVIHPGPPHSASPPPPSGPGLGVELGSPPGSHSRSISEATTSSDPDVDVLRGGLSQMKQRTSTMTTSTTVSTKKSSFFRKLVT